MLLDSLVELTKPADQWVRTRPNLGHQPFISILDRPQVAEGRCGYAGSNKAVHRTKFRPERTAVGTAVAARATLAPRGQRHAAKHVLRTPGCPLRRVHRDGRRDLHFHKTGVIVSLVEAIGFTHVFKPDGTSAGYARPADSENACS